MFGLDIAGATLLSGAVGAGASLFGGMQANSANRKMQEDQQFFAGNEARYLREFNAAEAQKASGS